MKLRFNDLPHVVRERFVQITLAGARDPRIIALCPATPLGWVKYVLAIGSLIAMAPMLEFTIRRGQTVDPIHDKEVYLGLAAAIAVFLLSISAIAFRFVWKPPPFTAGLYVFPSYLVKASGGDLDVTPLVETGTPTIVTVRRNGAHVHTRLELGGPFTFYYPNDLAAKESWARIAKARETFRAMLAARDANAIASVDPFAECTVSGAWVVPNQPPGGPLASSVPLGLAIARWVGAGLVGLFAAGAYFAIVDAVFDDERAEHDRASRAPVKRR